MKKLLVLSLVMFQQFAVAGMECYSPGAVVDAGYRVTVTDADPITATVNTAGRENITLAKVSPVSLRLLKKNPPIRVYHYTSKNISFHLEVDMQATPGGFYPGDFTLNTPDGSFEDDLKCHLTR